MIVFDLRCANAHVFEVWFGSSADYESQRARGLVTCPLCGDGEVGKAVMAPRLSTGAREETLSVAAPSPGDAERKAMLIALAQMQAKLLKSSEWVGKRFVDEARSIHLGESDQRAIHGEATPKEAAELAEEGIAVAPLLFPVAPPDTQN